MIVKGCIGWIWIDTRLKIGILNLMSVMILLLVSCDVEGSNDSEGDREQTKRFHFQLRTVLVYMASLSDRQRHDLYVRRL